MALETAPEVVAAQTVPQLLNSSPAPAGTTIVRPKEVLTPGTSPLDFIQKNLSNAGAKVVDPQALIDEEAAKLKAEDAALKPPTPLAPQEPSTQYDLNPEAPTTSTQTQIPEAPLGEDEAFDKELGIEGVSTAPENFKKLRVKAKETLKTLTATKKEKEELQAKLSRYETGEIVPDILQEKENRIQELSHYEKIHNLKMSPEYVDSFINPMNELKTKLATFAKDYQIPAEELNKALEITNQADLNRFLSNYFDDVGALEVKQVVKQFSDLRNRATEAEKKPAEMLQSLQIEHTKIKETRNVERRNKIADISRAGWSKALLKVREEGVARELIPDANDPDFNEKVVKPLTTAAAQEYGKLITLLAESGLENLSDEAAYAMARMSQLAHASAVSMASREAAIKHADEIEKGATRTQSIARPQIGGGRASGSGAEGPPKMRSPEEAGQALTQSILAQRK